MKLSKSILIFLFFSSFSGAFFCAMRRTKGNSFKSLQFALYFLAIQIGLIGPNIPLELNQDQPKQQLVSRVQPLPVYNRYVSTLDESRSSGLYMSKVERPSLVPQHSNSQKLVNELRAGDSRVTQAAWLLLTIWMLQQQSLGFQPVRQAPSAPHKFPPYYDFFSPRRIPSRPGTGSTLTITRPTAMPHQEFVGLTKEERRQLPHPNDMTTNHEGYPKLEVGFWQSKFKVGDHGAVHDLPYTVKDNGGTKTEKTDDNALKMMRSIVDMPNRDNVRCFEDGTYQRGTDREFEAIHIYDLDKQVIAVFKKSTGKFVTTCQLDRDEHNELLETHNFGGGKGWFSGQVKNLPPQQTLVDTFESDIMGITSISPMDENSSPNPDFTPMSSFESDVIGITPIDNSQFDNP